MPGSTIRVEGLKELRRDLKRVDPAVAKQFQGELKDAAGIVADSARGDVRGRLFSTGRLHKGIKPGASGNTATVRARAVRRGFNYAPVHEFRQGGAHAFLRPALARKERAVVTRLDRAVAKALGKLDLQ